MRGEFYDFDTETVNRPGGGHAVLLIKTVAGGHVLLREFPKTFGEIFDFLKGSKFVCWNMDFDACAIVHPHFLPVGVVERLALYSSARHGAFSFRYTPGKYLTVSRMGDGFTLYDLASFYGSSLADAAKKHLPEHVQKRKIPEAWYKDIDGCLRDNRRPRLLDYARGDVLALRGLREKILSQFSAMGIRPSRLTSPASISMLVFGRSLAKIRPSHSVNSLFQRSFFGGRVEIGTLGRVGPVRVYDIHSAYPSIMAGLREYDPIPRHSKSFNPDAEYGSYFIRVKVPTSWHWGPLAVRQGQKVIYPTGEFTTYCGKAGIELVTRLALPHEIYSSVELMPSNGFKIFPEIPDMYLRRKEPGLDIALKLVMNSAYGKTAESVLYSVEDRLNGRATGLYDSRSITSFGRYTNYPLAAAITERTRIKIFEVLHAHGKKAHAAATDGIITEGELKTGDGLGEWGLKGEFPSAVIFGCGRYVLHPSSGEPEFHLRGFPVKMPGALLSRLENCRRPFLDIPMLDSPSLRQWAQRYCAGDMNVLKLIKRRLQIDDDKRDWPDAPTRLSHLFRFRYRSNSLILMEKTPNARRQARRSPASR